MTADIVLRDGTTLHLRPATAADALALPESFFAQIQRHGQWLRGLGLSAGAPGKRYILPHARVLIHQPHGGASGQAVDIEIQAKEIKRMRETLDGILAHHTGQSLERVAKDTDRDFIMSGQEAKEYGIVDEVLTNRELSAVPSPEGTN